MKNVVYLLTAVNKTGSVKYIGSSINYKRRLKQHISYLKIKKHDNWLFQDFFDKDPNNTEFSMEILHESGDLTTIRFLEQEEIRSHQNELINMEYSKRKSDVMKKMFRDNPSAARKISDSSKRNWQRPDFIKRMKEIKKEQNNNEEYCRKRIDQLNNPETVLRKQENLKKWLRENGPTRSVEVSVNGITYPTLTEAGREYGINAVGVCKRIDSRNPVFKNWYRTSKPKTMTDYNTKSLVVSQGDIFNTFLEFSKFSHISLFIIRRSFRDHITSENTFMRFDDLSEDRKKYYLDVYDKKYCSM